MNAIHVHHLEAPEVLAFEQTPLPVPSGGDAIYGVTNARKSFELIVPAH